MARDLAVVTSKEKLQSKPQNQIWIWALEIQNTKEAISFKSPLGMTMEEAIQVFQKAGMGTEFVQDILRQIYTGFTDEKDTLINELTNQQKIVAQWRKKAFIAECT